MKEALDKIADLGIVIGLKDGAINKLREENMKLTEESARLRSENAQLKKAVEVNTDS